MYALERESNYTPLYKKYFYKKGTITTTGMISHYSHSLFSVLQRTST
jgi:hypothetical protein